MDITRRRTLAGLGAAPALAAAAHAPRFEASWESLAAGYRCPDWFRDAKLGIWAHWGPQCVAEFGDWYGRFMYMQGSPAYAHHVATYGHPSRFGFMELINRWQAERWDPEALMKRYVAAGARYFVAMANHHDNLDMYASRHHAWNTTRVGPRRDIVATWARVARAAGLRFGVSNHAAHAWHWWQTAYGYDAEGPLRGVRYDAWRLRKADGRGRWWEGLDPQELYTGPNIAPPDGIDTIAAMEAWHAEHTGQWMEHPPPKNPHFVANWLARQNDLFDQHRPDLVYFDNTGLPLGQAGLSATAHIYTQVLARKGATDVVVNAKKLSGDQQRRAVVEDVERGFSDRIQAEPWQTDTCIGEWHYSRPLYERGGYKSAIQVIQRLADVVSKNGCLLLSIPLRGDGSIDDKEEAVLDGMAAWMAVNGEAIFATRPWRTFGEGPTSVVGGVGNEGDAKPFTAADVRYTTKRGVLYALPLEWPVGEVKLGSLAAGQPGEVRRVELLGSRDPLPFRRSADGLTIALPQQIGRAHV